MADQVFLVKTGYSGSGANLTSIPNSALTNSSITINGTPVSLGGSVSNLATTTDVSTAISNLVNSAPATLDTLNELATALGNDANFSTTITNSLAAKAPLASPTFTGTVILPDGTITNGMLAGSIENNKLSNSSITINGSSISLGGSISGLATTSNPTFTTIGGDEGGQINFGLPATNTTLNTNIAIDSYQDKVRIFEGGGTSRGVFIDLANATAGVASQLITNDGNQTLTNKTINASNNTLSNIPNSALTNSSITINGSAVSLGGSTTISASGDSDQIILASQVFI